MADKFLVIDGSSLIHRAFFALPPLVTKQGVNTGAVYGLCNMLLKLLADVQPKYMAVAFDKSRKTFRTELFADYKGQRKPTPSELSEQFPLATKVLEAMNIAVLEMDNYEADDIIATLATHWSENIGNCYISSNDFDFVQMVSDKIILLRTVQGKLINCDAQFVRQRFNITPEQYIEYMALVGDKTDNISGVPYIGKKIASDLLNEYGNLDNIFNNLDTSNNEIHQRLSWCKNTAYNNREFITMNRHIPIYQILDGVLPETDSQLIQRKISFYMEQIGI